MNCSKLITPSPGESEKLLIPDLIKGFAILWVVIFHVLFDFTNLYCGKDDILNGLLCKILLHGSLGVDLFVILSGYLLSRSCAGKKNIYWGEFLKNRLWRIFPLYWFAIFLVITLATIRANGSNSLNWLSIGSHVLGLHGLTPYIFDIQGVWWFITLILQLYIIFPLIYKLIEKYNIYVIFVFSILFMICARFADAANVNTNYSLFAFIPVFLYGIIIGKNDFELKYKYSIPLFSLCLSSIFLFILIINLEKYSVWSSFFGLIRSYISIGIFITLCFIFNLVKKYKIFCFVFSAYGKHSYGIYLFHRVFIYKFITFFSSYMNNFFVLVLFLISVLIFGIFVEKIEKIMIGYSQCIFRAVTR